MAKATINYVHCVSVSTGFFIPSDFLAALQALGTRLLPSSIAEVVDAASEAASSFISALAGADDLCITAGGSKIWPTDAPSKSIDNGDTLDVFEDLMFSGQEIVALREMDGDDLDDSDDLGSFFVDEEEDLGVGQIAKLVVSESEGSAYYIFYEVV